MLHTNYSKLLKMMIIRNRGFWRIEAISKLSKQMEQGQYQLEYLKNMITKHERSSNIHSFLQIESSKSKKKKINIEDKARSKSSQTFFVTQTPSAYGNKFKKYNNKLFMNEYEEFIYNPIELHPFEIKYIRKRDENQKYYNVQEIKKEIEKNYNYIRSEYKKNRPFTSSGYINNKNINSEMKHEIKNIYNSNSLSANRNYYTNNINMSKRRKKGYKIPIDNNFNSNNITNENFKNSKQKRRVVSAYLSNRERGNFFAEENTLFENIKKNKYINQKENKRKKINNFISMYNDKSINIF